MRMFKLIAIVLTLSLVGCSTLSRMSDDELSISGTTWNYTDDDGDNYNITFGANGRMQTTHPNDRTDDNDYWSQTGTLVEFEYNDGYSKYTGKMKSTKLITGSAQSVAGKWKWKLKRIE